MKLLIAIPVGHVFKVRGNPNVARNYLKFSIFSKCLVVIVVLLLLIFFLVLLFISAIQKTLCSEGGQIMVGPVVIQVQNLQKPQ